MALPGRSLVWLSLLSWVALQGNFSGWVSNVTLLVCSVVWLFPMAVLGGFLGLLSWVALLGGSLFGGSPGLLSWMVLLACSRPSWLLLPVVGLSLESLVT